MLILELLEEGKIESIKKKKKLYFQIIVVVEDSGYFFLYYIQSEFLKQLFTHKF